MNALEHAIKNALDLCGSTNEANKAYLEFIKANFMIPIEKNSASNPMVLFLQEQNQTFLPVFTDRVSFNNWAHEIADDIDILTVSGVDLLKNIGDDVCISLNLTSVLYKEFNPQEIARMRSIVLKFFPIKQLEQKLDNLQ